MSDRRPLCHPDREPLGTEGLCRTCYHREWKRNRRAEIVAERSRSCALCVEPFHPADLRAIYCSKVCSRIGVDLARSRHEGEEVHATRDPALARQLAAAYSERGCRRVSKKTNQMMTRGAYIAAWRRGAVYLIRARLPPAFRSEDHEEQAA